MLNVSEGQAPPTELRSRKYRFTSNVIATIILGVDLLCLVLGSLLAPFAYEMILGPRYFIDPEQRLVGVFFMQRPSERGAVHAEYRAVVYGALK